jgi:hypothetical protein
MTYRGKVKNGVVVLEDPKALPEGADVTIRLVKAKGNSAKSGKGQKTLRPGVMKFAGKAKDLPADAAENLDHYLYGHAKQ